MDTANDTQFERNWAMLSHLTALLTVLAGLATGGAGAVVALLVPLGLHLYFRERSPHVAFHALQATVYQAAGGVVCVALAAVAGLVLTGAWVVVGVLSFLLVGVLLLPAALGLTLLVLLDIVALPVVLLAGALRGAYLTYEGRPFAYPLVGSVAARTMGWAGTSSAAPA